MKLRAFMLAVALLFVALMHAYAVAQPTQGALVEAWERVQREDPETIAFEKTGQRTYHFKTGRFPFDGELKVLKATVDATAADDSEYGFTSGVIEYDLVGLSDEVVKKYEHSYRTWERTNTLYLDRDGRTWLSSEEQLAKVRAKAAEAMRAHERNESGAGQTEWRGQGGPFRSLVLSLSAMWLPVLLLIGVWVWIMKGTGLGRQREYMTHAALHMQNVEDLLARIASAMERDAPPRPDAGARETDAPRA